jgi:hypothetical protein
VNALRVVRVTAPVSVVNSAMANVAPVVKAKAAPAAMIARVMTQIVPVKVQNALLVSLVANAPHAVNS